MNIMAPTTLNIGCCLGWPNLLLTGGRRALPFVFALLYLASLTQLHYNHLPLGMYIHFELYPVAIAYTSTNLFQSFISFLPRQQVLTSRAPFLAISESAKSASSSTIAVRHIPHIDCDLRHAFFYVVDCPCFRVAGPLESLFLLLLHVFFVLVIQFEFTIL